MRKKTFMVFFIVFQIIFCFVSSVLSAPINKSQIIGKPANKSWVVKFGKNTEGDILLFSEDKGKTFFSIPGMAYRPNAVIWSPDGKYFFFVGQCDMGIYDDPFLKDGIWHHYPMLYDPVKRVLFSPPKISNSKTVLGAGWVSGSKNDILLGIYNMVDSGDDYMYVEDPTADPDSKKKLSVMDWEKTSAGADVSPYLYWLSGEIVSRLKNKKLSSIRDLIKGAPKPDVDSTMKYILESLSHETLLLFNIQQFVDSGDDVFAREKTFWVMIGDKSGNTGIHLISITATVGKDLMPQITKISAGWECGL